VGIRFFLSRLSMKKLILIIVTSTLSENVFALEPVTALDTAFSVPSSATMVESVLFYPGAESFTRSGFALGAWSVPFGMDDLAVSTGLAGRNFGTLGLSTSYSGSGFDLYGDEQEKIGISFAPLKYLSSGIRLSRNALRIKGFGDASTWSTDIGAIIRPWEKVFFGLAYEDITNAELGESKEPLDGRARLSASWLLPGNVTLISSVTKVRRFNPSVTCGVMFELWDALTTGIAGGNEPDRFEFLCLVKRQRFCFSYHGSYHRELGMTHGFSLQWSGASTSPQPSL
jgi:hypothetical protein